MLRQTHVVDVGSGNNILRHGDGLVPEAEVDYAIRTFGHSKEALAVGSFYTGHDNELAIPFYFMAPALKTASIMMRCSR